MSEAARPLAILCGGGALALEAARMARQNGRKVFLIGMHGSAGPEIETFEHIWVKLGEVGKLLAALKERAIQDMAILGAVSRPEFSDIRLDWGAITRAAEIARLFRGGDNSLLTGIAGIFEREGLRIVGPKDFAPQLLAPAGLIAGAPPQDETLADIRFATDMLTALSPFDVGQGAVAAHRRIVAVEAAEGTDAMLSRVADLRAARRLKFKGRVGIFVKAAKRGQDMRLDLPTVGVRTVEAAARAELAGLAIQAGEVMIADRTAFVMAAEAAGLFVWGWTA